MIVAALFFYLFAGVCIASAFMVIAARNPVHSVLFLILAFVNARRPVRAAGRRVPGDDPDRRLCRRGRGAVPVRGDDARRRFRRAARRASCNICRSAPWSASSSWSSWCWCVGAWAIGPGVQQAIAAPIPPIARMLNTEALGHVLYTRYVYFFQAAGLVLLVAMIGAIVLTLRHKPNVKRQNIAEQIARTKATAIEIVKVRPGQGLRDAGGRHDHRARPLSHRRRDPVHARHLRHLPQPQERHRHPDVDRADPARGQHQSGRVLDLSSATSSARSSRCLVLTVAAAEAAIGLAILVVYYRNRGSIAVEDINLMKG